ncbi:DUF3226 domain-containing protein [Pyrococcus horikoshii]|uniref:DUF4276 family protein n=2 Tax=Pyrococcus horikoshii TaxID=53953 RepID=O57895_PYRHO|nr:DUF3226 domain-containing protein [Pyrococcus horikoshii]2P62_A Chain A, Hypothetical protein PH0156 [Pyrococcus horikoshii OT3]2P62_B Chain B, Hypothetical protein PH0156 [Pyrococcus horikoshii OT3]BAA29225.1 241aa long hypothetical protein [Pyrococcus horikoshii OT3]HII61498.1 DUF3226 domain-containing protein [Pyrococcus horikoshii]
MRIKLIIVEGKTDESFFKVLLEKLYGFREAKKLTPEFPIGKWGFRIGEHPLVLEKDNIALVIIHAEGKQRIPKVLKSVLDSVKLGLLNVEEVYVVRDVDEGNDVFEWVLSFLREREVRVDNGAIVTEGVKIYPYGMGNLTLNEPFVKEKKELELSLAYLAKLDGILEKYRGSMRALSQDKGDKLTPKDVMHILSIANDYTGDCLSGLYEKYIGIMIHRNRELLIRFLSEVNLLPLLERMVG